MQTQQHDSCQTPPSTSLSAAELATLASDERMVMSTADLSAAELLALAAARTPPELDYDYSDD